MKLNGLALLGITTLLLITSILFLLLDLAFGYIFLLTVFGQLLLVWTVFKILKDDYSTDKTFDDFYEDYPIGKQYR